MRLKERLFITYKSEANEKLFDYIPVIYGAVLSYGFYVLTLCFADFYNSFKRDSSFAALASAESLKFLIQVGLFSLTMLYLIIDLGGMVKVTHHFKYKHHSRFIHDILIGMFFLIMFHEIKQVSIVYIAAFAFNYLFAAIWGNNLKEEARLFRDSNSERFERWGLTIRKIHYVGAVTMTLIFAISMILNYYKFKPDYIFAFNVKLLILLVIGFYFWYIRFLYYTTVYSGTEDRELSIPIGLPYFLISFIIEFAEARKPKIIEKYKKIVEKKEKKYQDKVKMVGK